MAAATKKKVKWDMSPKEWEDASKKKIKTFGPSRNGQQRKTSKGTKVTTGGGF